MVFFKLKTAINKKNNGKIKKSAKIACNMLWFGYNDIIKIRSFL